MHPTESQSPHKAKGRSVRSRFSYCLGVFIACTEVLLVLLAGGCAFFWARSYWHSESIFLTRARVYSIESVRGHFYLSITWELGEPPVDIHELIRAMIKAKEEPPPPREDTFRRGPSATAWPQAYRLPDHLFPYREKWLVTTMSSPAAYLPSTNWLGFAARANGPPQSSLIRLGSNTTIWETYLVVPTWFIFIALMALPIGHIAWRQLRYRPTPKGLCERCGYDLRASVERCPECGTPVDNP